MYATEIMTTRYIQIEKSKAKLPAAMLALQAD
jgi:hypothetical protein